LLRGEENQKIRFCNATPRREEENQGQGGKIKSHSIIYTPLENEKNIALSTIRQPEYACKESSHKNKSYYDQKRCRKSKESNGKAGEVEKNRYSTAMKNEGPQFVSRESSHMLHKRILGLDPLPRTKDP